MPFKLSLQAVAKSCSVFSVGEISLPHEIWDSQLWKVGIVSLTKKYYGLSNKILVGDYSYPLKLKMLNFMGQQNPLRKTHYETSSDSLLNVLKMLYAVKYSSYPQQRWLNDGFTVAFFPYISKASKMEYRIHIKGTHPKRLPVRIRNQVFQLVLTDYWSLARWAISLHKQCDTWRLSMVKQS